MEDQALSAIMAGLEKLPNTRFKILIRRDGLRIVGIISVIKSEPDSELGESRLWAHGVRLDGSWFKEPLDRKNPMLRKIEHDVILIETPHFILTARRSSNPGDEKENFMYLENPLGIEEGRKILASAEVQERVIASTKQEVERLRNDRDYWQVIAESQGDTVREAKERISILSKETSILRHRSIYLALVADGAAAHGMVVRGMLDKILKDAREKGIQLEESDTERAIRSAEELGKLREKLGPLSPRETVAPEDINKLRRELEVAQKKLAELEPPAVAEGKRKPAPAAATPAGPAPT